MNRPPVHRRAYHRARRLAGRSLRRVGLRRSPGTFPAPPWVAVRTPRLPGHRVRCNICRWSGPAFEGPVHCEGNRCPGCGSIGRDRFLHRALTSGPPLRGGERVLETSPRLGDAYRDAMGQWFDYRASDYDESAHRASVRIDLQDIDLPDDSLDIVLSAHVLEHVPDTDRALHELRRVIAPGGRLVLQVPVLQGATAPPETPEFHEDHTPVFWRFGPDLTARLRDHGFRVRLMCTEQLLDHARTGRPWRGPRSPEFDVDGIIAHLVPSDLVAVADAQQATMLGLHPAFMYLTWECVVPA